MRVQFITTSQSKLNEIPIIDGQIISLYDSSGYYYDMGGSRHDVIAIEHVDELPEVGESRVIYLTITTNPRRTIASFYIWDSDVNRFWLVAGGSSYEEMTDAEYEALTDEEKMDGTVRYITDKGKSVINDAIISADTTFSSSKLIDIIPTELADLDPDPAHMTVSAGQIASWTGKQDALTAGDHISLSQDGVISVTSGSFDLASSSKDGIMSSADKVKLDTISPGADANVQVDWNESDSTSPSFLKNKPLISGVNVDTSLSDTSSNPVENKAIVAALEERPTTSELATVALTGKYDDLTESPTVPTSLSQLAGDEYHRSVTDADITYWNAQSSKVNEVDAKVDQVDTKIDTQVAALESNFQGGVDSIYDAIVAQGTTPDSKSLSDIVAGIDILSTAKTDEGVDEGAEIASETIYDAIVAQGTTPTSKSLSDVTTGISTLASDKYSEGNDDGYSNGYSKGYEIGYRTGETEYMPVSSNTTLGNGGDLTVKNGNNTLLLSKTFANNYNSGYSAGKDYGYAVAKGEFLTYEYMINLDSENSFKYTLTAPSQLGYVFKQGDVFVVCIRNVALVTERAQSSTGNFGMYISNCTGYTYRCKFTLTEAVQASSVTLMLVSYTSSAVRAIDLSVHVIRH